MTFVTLVETSGRNVDAVCAEFVEASLSKRVH